MHMHIYKKKLLLGSWDILEILFDMANIVVEVIIKEILLKSLISF